MEELMPEKVVEALREEGTSVTSIVKAWQEEAPKVGEIFSRKSENKSVTVSCIARLQTKNPTSPLLPDPNNPYLKLLHQIRLNFPLHIITAPQLSAKTSIRSLPNNPALMHLN